jgi:hypothetical protein
MKRTSYLAYFTLTALAASGLALAQDNNSQNRGWRRVDDPAAADLGGAPQPDQNVDNTAGAPPPPPPAAAQTPRYSGQPAPPPPYNRYPSPYSQPGYGQNQASNPGYPQQAPPPGYQQQQAPPPAPQAPIPSSLTIRPGTYITVRVNQVLSSDHNHPGDAFSATLVKPLVVDGVVVADRGQTIGGRVAETKKAGMVEGTSKLGVQLTDLTLTDGQNLPVSTPLISRTGSTSVDRDAAAIAGTTAVGAMAGAAADWGRGAAIGAGAGAAAGIIGVLLTRGRPTVIYPEQVLTFRLESPVSFTTDRAPQAFRYVEPGDYQQPSDLQHRPAPQMRVATPAPYYYGGPYLYRPGYYPYYYYGPSVGFYFGRGYYRGWRR